MKKIFTLLAVAAVALSAKAITWNVTADFKAEDNKTYAETTDCPVTFTADGKWADVKADQFGSAADYPELTHSIQGGSNPKCGGAGYKNDNNFDFPDEGCGYIFSPAKDGVLKIYAKLAGGKASRVVTGTEFAPFECVHADGTPCSWMEDITNGIDGDGQCVVTVNVKAGTKYCLVTNGSKATFYGYDFAAAGGTTAIEAIAADENAPVEYFNLQGTRVSNPENGLYIRRQGNKVAKVVL